MLHKIFSAPSTPAQKNKKECKRAFRDEFLQNPILSSFNGTSYLHMAAKQKLFKEMARLIYYGADVSMKDETGKTAFAYLDLFEIEKVTNLQLQLTKLISEMSCNNIEIISKHIFTLNKHANSTFDFNYFNDRRNRIQAKRILNTLNQNPLLQPLFTIVKLSFLGLHDLSNRSKHTDTNYDSDEDENEKTSFQQYLSVAVDDKCPTVERIFHGGNDGLEGNDSHGLYNNKNQLFIGAGLSLLRPLNKVLITFLHELTHFICKEVFLNDAKPYTYLDIKQALIIRHLILDLKIKIKTGDVTIKTFKDMFNSYKEDDYPVEFIARISELLFDDDGKRLLKSQTPELLTFYENTFLPAVKEHLARLEERALSGWPKELPNRNSLKARL